MPNITVNSEAEWLTLREQHIGGSEVASLFYEWEAAEDKSLLVRHLFETPGEGDELVGCLGSFRTGYRLYMEKAGLLQPDDFGESERVQAGKHLEPAIAAWAKDKFQWEKLRKVRRYITHPLIVGWGASLDFEINEPGRPPIEFKNVDYGYFKDNWILEDDEIVGLPLQYNLQLQHQLGAAECEYGYIVACVGGNKLYRGRIYRHEPTQQRIAEAIEAFWTAVGEGHEPAEYADFKTVATMLAFGEREKTVDLTEVAEIDVDQAIRKYLRLDGVIKRLEKRLDHRKAAFARFITDEATRAITKEYNISWPSYTRPAGMSEPKFIESATWRMGLRVSKKKPPKEAKVKKAKASEAAMTPAAAE